MENESHVPTVQDLIDLPEPADAQISPDGMQVAYVLRKPDWKENTYISQIWLADSEGQSSQRRKR